MRLMQNTLLRAASHPLDPLDGTISSRCCFRCDFVAAIYVRVKGKAACFT